MAANELRKTKYVASLAKKVATETDALICNKVFSRAVNVDRITRYGRFSGPSQFFQICIKLISSSFRR